MIFIKYISIHSYIYALFVYKNNSSISILNL